jgi:hypothetical protein
MSEARTLAPRPDWTTESIVDRLLVDRPSFHLGGRSDWSALPDTLNLLHDLVSPGDRTVETGSGASSIVFAAAGARHLAISPDAVEHARIADYCDQIGVALDAVTFNAGCSDRVLPALPAEERFDVAFIDGKHAYPLPTVDFHYIEQLLVVGGVIVLDDVPIRTVRGVYDFMASSPCWELVAIADDRAAAFKKVAAAPLDDDWRFQSDNQSYPDFSFVPIQRRARLDAEEYVGRAKRRLGAIPTVRRLANRLR